MIAWKRNLVLAWLMATASSVAAFAASSPDRLKDSVVVGQGTASTKKITFDIGSGSANPAIQSTSAGVLQFAMDGVNFSTFGTGTGGGTGVSVLKNSGFEIGTANWTSAGSATFTTTASGANVGFDLAAGAWTPSATGATLTSDQYTVPSGMYGSVCSASVWYLGGSANVTLKVINGSSTVLASQVLSAQTAYVQTADLRFACPSSGTFALQLASTGSSATVYLDNAFLGQAPRRAPEDRNENLVVNGNAEDGLNPTNWTTYNDGASAALLTGTGGTASGLAAAAISSTSPIGGSRSWLMSKTGGSSAQGQGWSYQFTVNAKSQYQNALNDLAFDYYFDAGGAANADTVRVYLYDVTNSAVITPTFVTCGGGSTPSLAAVTTTCHAELGWLASATATTYRLGFHVAGTTTSTFNLTVDNLFVGQHRLTVGTQVGAWQAYTPTSSWVTNSNTPTGQYRRVGDSLEIEVYQNVTGAPNATALTFSMPTGYTINTSALPSSGANATFGTWAAYHASTLASYLGAVTYNNTTSVVLLINGASGGSGNYLVGATQPFTWANTDQASAHFTVPVNEIAGGSAFGENRCEYASNSKTDNTATDTASFVYGPAGQTIPNGAVGTTYSRRVRFLTPINPTDKINVEIDQGSGSVRWVDAAQWFPRIYQSSLAFGIEIDNVNATDLDVFFATGGYTSNGSYGVAGSASWANISTQHWRVKKCSAGIATAFGQAQGNGVPGLYTPGQTAGYVNGGAIGAGYVGQILTNSGAQSGPTSTTVYTPASVTLTPGVWLVNGRCSVGYATPPSITMIKGGTSLTAAGIDDSTFTTITTYGSATAMDSGNGYSVSGIPRYLSVSASTPVYTVCTMGYTGGTSLAFNAWIQAIRIH